MRGRGRECRISLVPPPVSHFEAVRAPERGRPKGMMSHHGPSRGRETDGGRRRLPWGLPRSLVRLLASEGRPRRFAEYRAPLAVFLFAAVVFFARSWEGDLRLHDPIHYAAVAKTILKTGNWWVLQNQPGTLYANKPPLMFWLIAANFRLFGASTYAAKFWSCMFAVLTCVLTCLLARRVFGDGAGILAGCMAATFPGVIWNAVDVRLDSTLAFCTVLAAYAVVRAHQADRPQWLLLAGLAAGIGTMTKAVALVHVGAVTACILVLWRPRWLLSPYLGAAVGLTALLGAPWHLMMVSRVGAQFSDAYFGHQILRRLIPGAHLPGNLWANVAVLLVRGVPWWPLSACACLRWRGAESDRRKGMLASLLWIATVVVFMAVPPVRYDRYMVPAYPALALLAGHEANRLLPAGIRATLPRVVVWLAVAVGLTLVIVPVPLHRYRSSRYVAARPVLDNLDPGETLAIYVPERPRPKTVTMSLAVYYLDRRLVTYHDLERLEQSDAKCVMARSQERRRMEASGFRVVLSLDREYDLLWRIPAASPEAG